MEEKLLSFVLVYKLAYTELHGSDSFVNVYPVFVSKFYFDCESNIRKHSTVDRRAYYNAIQNVFVVYIKFLITDSTKKTSEGQTFLGFVLLIWLSVYFVAGKTTFRCLISACLQCLWSLRLVQLNLVSLGTKGKYKEGKEIFLAIVLLCKLSMRISLLLDVIYTALYVTIQKFEFYANCRMRKCETVFIKTLGATVRWSSNILICEKILFTTCTAAVHLGLQFYNWRIKV